MKVVINGTQTFYVGWKYENPKLEEMLQNKGITVQQMREMKVPEIANALGLRVSDLPKPLITRCLIHNDDKVKILDVIVKKYHKEKFDVDKARKYSLGKALSTLFSGTGHKQTRKGFWDAYNSRNLKKKEENVNKEIPQAVQADVYR